MGGGLPTGSHIMGSFSDGEHGGRVVGDFVV